MVQPRSCRVIYYFDTPTLRRRHQSFGRVSNPQYFKEKKTTMLNSQPTQY